MSTVNAKTGKIITVTIPDVGQNIKNLLSASSEKLKSFYFDLKNSSVDIVNNSKKINVSKLSNAWSNFPKKQKRLIFFIALITVVVILGAKAIRSTSVSANRTSTNEIESLEINKGFSFPIKTSKTAKDNSSISYTITKAEITKTIVIKGQSATAIKGRAFLIVNLKIENPTTSSITMKTRDFVRLLPEGSEDKLAPDIHNDPTEVQAISTKITRVGFPVDENAKKFQLFIGEIEGEKQAIDINFN